jgi:hypothetical protein
VAGEANCSISEALNMRVVLVFAYLHGYMAKEGVKCTVKGSGSSLEDFFYLR